MIDVKMTTQTNGIGFWTATRRKVEVTGLDLWEGELRAHFVGWDTYELGVIYTDEGWLHSFKEELKRISPIDMHKAIDKIGYSEYGMQGEDFVSMDVPETFKLPF